MIKELEGILTRHKIDGVDVYLENFDHGKGKIIISDCYDKNYSYYWGSMGDSIEDFICKINSDYFMNCLIGYDNKYSFDSMGTFSNIRKHIREEISLPWYKHMAFQKDMRERLNSFQNDCEDISDESFVDRFYHFIKYHLDYTLLDNNSYRYDRECIENDFKSIEEPWHFISTKPSINNKWLMNFHSKLVKRLRNR